MEIVRNKKVKTVDFDELKQGDCFSFVTDGDIDDEVWMKLDCDQDAVDLADGTIYSDLCGDKVIPIKAKLIIE